MFDELLEKKLEDGSRHFVDLPVEFAFFDELYDHAKKLRGGEITEFLTNGIMEMWLDFKYRGHKFSVTNQYTDYWFFVEEAGCSENILIEVIDHFRKLLNR